MSKLQKALEKAQEKRGGTFEYFTAAPELLKEGRQEVQVPQYVKTRCLPVDFDLLRQNHIIPICHGSLAADRFKILRTKVLNRMVEEGKNTLLITSANPGEGKTVTAINLAISVSHELDRTTLLVDTDLRKPDISRYFGLNVKQGLTDYLEKRAELSDLLISPGLDKVVILPCGQAVTNSAEFLGSPRMESLVQELKKRYPDRFIIFDSPSLLNFADPLVFSRFIDGILIVVEAENTTREDLRRTLEVLKDRPVIGTLLNKVRD